MENFEFNSLYDIKDYLVNGSAKLNREDRENFLEEVIFDKPIQAYSFSHGMVELFKVNPKSKFPIYGHRVGFKESADIYPITWKACGRLFENMASVDLYASLNVFFKSIYSMEKDLSDITRPLRYGRIGKPNSNEKEEDLVFPSCIAKKVLGEGFKNGN